MDTSGQFSHIPTVSGAYANPGSPQPYPGYPPPVVSQPMSSQTSNTTVVVVGPQAPPPRQLRDWNTGLFACFDDCAGCLFVTYCYTCATHTLVHDVNESGCILYCLPNWITVTRSKIRNQLGIRGSILNDCCVETFCPQCAVCQMIREVKIAKESGYVFF